MMIYKRGFLIGIVLFVSGALKAQDNNDCKILLQKVYQRNNIAANQNIFLEYTFTTYYKDRQVQESASEYVKFYANNQRSRYLGKYATVYVDEKHQAAILPDRKLVVLTKRDTTMLQSIIKEFISRQESLLKEGEITDCQDITIANESQRKIMLKPIDGIGKGMGVDNMVIWIDPRKQQLKKMRINYIESARIHAIEIQMVKTDYSYKEPVFSGTAISQVLDKSGKLLPNYKDYILRDLRK